MGEFERVEIIQALAGSGKTQLLACRFIRLMKLGADPKTILATTFSRKAAGEIRDRIVDMLSAAVLTKRGFEQLVIGVPEINSNPEIGRKECAVLLQNLVSIIHRLNIGTIDSFFIKTALAFSDTLELSHGWAILDEVHEDEIFSDAMHRLTKDSSNAKKLATILRLCKSGAKVPIDNTVDSIQKASFSSVRGSDKHVWVWGTSQPILSDVALQQVISHAENLQLKKSAQAKALVKAIIQMNCGDWKSFLTTGMAPKIIDEIYIYSRAQVEQDVVKAYKPLIAHGFGVMTNRMLLKNKSTFELISDLNSCWLDAKHHRGYYSFDDVAFQLSNSDIMDKLIELQFRMDGSIDHMLVDEFQDTSLTQWKVLEPLIHEINQATNDRSLFFVGDVKQSLYGFRGGEPALLRGLDQELIHAHTTRLDASWRCTPPILEAVNEVFGNVERVPLLLEHSPEAAKIWMQDYVTHVSAAPTQLLKGYADIQTAGSDPDKSPLQLCIEKVVELTTKIHKDAPSATIGILVRSNTKQQIQRIVHALRAKDVPASEFGGNPLTDSPAVTVILSALLMSDDQNNSVHTFHVCSSPLGVHLNLGCSLPAEQKSLDDVCKSIRRKLLRDGYANLINEFAEQLVKHVDERERLRLWQLVELAESYAQDKTLRPSEFVRVVSTVPVQDPASSKIQVMTVHKSKGLSFDAVIVCDLDQAIWKTPSMMELHGSPCQKPIRVGMFASEYLDNVMPEYKEMRMESRRNQVNDALCLLYVAMTRARHAMHIVIPCRQNATNHYKKLDGLLLQCIDEQQQQKPNEKIWVADSSNPNWKEDIKNDPIIERGDIPDFTIYPPAEALMHGRGIASATSSSLEGGGKTIIAERFEGCTNIALDLGTITHAWFEQIDWLAAVPSIETLLDSVPSEFVGRVSAVELQGAAQRYISALQSSDISQLLTQPDEPVEIYREQDFVVRVDDGERFANVKMKEPTEIRGSIDRLVVFIDDAGKPIRAEVIDWKTDSYTTKDELQGLIEHYAPQLSSYRLAASKLLGIELGNIAPKLVFVSSGKVCDITDKT